MLTLLLTRPLDQSRAFAAALEARLPGRFSPLYAPLLGIAPCRGPIDLAGVVALAFTSANGVRAFAETSAHRALPAYCVGASTADAARAAGFVAHDAGGDAAALADLIAQDRPGPILHLCGRHAAADLAAMLAARGLPARAAVIYDQRPLAPPPEVDALGRAGRIEAIPVFSPRSARILADAAAGWDLSRATTLAISPAADAALAGLASARRLVAPAPSRSGMIAGLAAL